jgi:hypothetical protein
LQPAFDPEIWRQFSRLIESYAFADADALLMQVLAHLPGA